MPVKYSFKGAVPNEEVHKFYSENRVDCFLSASTTEGLPESIMEAISYGIPVVATDVGGTFELIKDNGILLGADPTDKDIADALYSVMIDPEKQRQMSDNSRKIWEDRFDSEKNAKKFAGILEKISGLGSGKLLYFVDSVANNWPFISSEITELSKHYDVILIDGAGNDSNIPDAVSAVLDDNKIRLIRPSLYKKAVGEAKHLFGYFTQRECRDERKQILSSKKRILRRLYESAMYYTQAQLFYDWIKREGIIRPDENAVYYTYWHQPYTLAMVLHRKEYPNLKLITREHGFDLYDERREKSLRQPFRKVMDPMLDAIIFVCETGKKYYTGRHAADPCDEKYIVSYVGSKPPVSSENTTAGQSEEDKIPVRIISCSNMVAIKRIDLIIEALSLLEKKIADRDIEWVHFGDGEERSRIEEMAQRRFGV